jgi:hypothetical protein
MDAIALLKADHAALEKAKKKAPRTPEPDRVAAR